jgi:hypothetical protein
MWKVGMGLVYSCTCPDGFFGKFCEYSMLLSLRVRHLKAHFEFV